MLVSQNGNVQTEDKKEEGEERKMSRCFTRFPIVGLGEPNIYQNLGDFTRMRDFSWKVSVVTP